MKEYLFVLMCFGVAFLGCSPINPQRIAGWYERRIDSNYERIHFFSIDSSFDYSINSDVCCPMVVTGLWSNEGRMIKLLGRSGYTGDLPPGPYRIDESLDESIHGYQFRFLIRNTLIEAPIQVFLDDDTVSQTTSNGVLTVDLPKLTSFRVYSDFNRMRAYSHEVIKYGSNVFAVHFAFSDYPCDSVSFVYKMRYKNHRLYQLDANGKTLRRKPFQGWKAPKK
jgi:hypothetical protein